MVNFRDKYLNSKYKYFFKQKGNGEAYNDITIFNTIDNFVNYQYPNPCSVNRSKRMKSFLEKFCSICSDEYSIAQISFINVPGDGLCFFTSIYRWFQLYNPENIIDYDVLIYTIVGTYKLNLIEQLIGMGFQAKNDDELSEFASIVGLSYPMNPNAPELEIICKIISNMLGVNIMIIRHKIDDRLDTTSQIRIPSDSILNILFRFNTEPSKKKY
jgi:hypothetical protein